MDVRRGGGGESSEGRGGDTRKVGITDANKKNVISIGRLARGGGDEQVKQLAVDRCAHL